MNEDNSDNSVSFVMIAHHYTFISDSDKRENLKNVTKKDL